MATLTRIIKDQSAFNAKEKLYASNSELLAQVLEKLDLEYLYEPILHKGSLSSNVSIYNSKRLSEAQTIKLAYCDNKTKPNENDYTLLLEEISDKKISARELVIYPFAIQYKPQVTLAKPTDTISVSKEFRKLFNYFRA